tara:strand:+ start:8922 stop:9530 length:609 start_codon:yes stop_codon:yes gene_type:complete
MTEWMEDALNDPRQTSIFDVVKEPTMSDSLETLDLEELRELSRQPVSKCALCGGRSKVYAYKLGSYVRVLCWLAYMDNKRNSMRHEQLPSESHNGSRWHHHIPSSGAINGGGDYAKLRYWGLMERMPKDPEQDKRSSGMWRLTKTGKMFVYGKATVSSVCYYRHPEGGVLGFEPKQIGIEEALGKKFSYKSLMAGYTGEAAQ